METTTSDSSRSGAASMLAKQLRIKLSADDESGIPRPYRNIMVSIHAIATFRALDDYLRPRISLVDMPEFKRARRTLGSPFNRTVGSSQNSGAMEAESSANTELAGNATNPSESTASPELPLELVLLLQQDPIQDDEVVDISVSPQLSSLLRVDLYLSVRTCLVTCWDGC